jgi:hypothetical protein
MPGPFIGNRSASIPQQGLTLFEILYHKMASIIPITGRTIMKLLYLGLIPAVLSVAACATITRGTTEQLTFDSDPPSSMRTSTGLSCPTTPCTLEVSRKSEFIATFTKDGYQSTDVAVQTRVAGSGAAGFAGNVLVGGVIGMAVDAGSGSTLEHFPNPVTASLVPDVLRGRARRTKTRRPSEESVPAM